MASRRNSVRAQARRQTTPARGAGGGVGRLYRGLAEGGQVVLPSRERERAQAAARVGHRDPSYGNYAVRGTARGRQATLNGQAGVIVGEHFYPSNSDRRFIQTRSGEYVIELNARERQEIQAQGINHSAITNIYQASSNNGLNGTVYQTQSANGNVDILVTPEGEQWYRAPGEGQQFVNVGSAAGNIHPLLRSNAPADYQYQAELGGVPGQVWQQNGVTYWIANDQSSAKVWLNGEYTNDRDAIQQVFEENVQFTTDINAVEALDTLSDQLTAEQAQQAGLNPLLFGQPANAFSFSDQFVYTEQPEVSQANINPVTQAASQWTRGIVYAPAGPARLVDDVTETDLIRANLRPDTPIANLGSATAQTLDWFGSSLGLVNPVAGGAAAAAPNLLRGTYAAFNPNEAQLANLSVPQELIAAGVDFGGNVIPSAIGRFVAPRGLVQSSQAAASLGDDAFAASARALDLPEGSYTSADIRAARVGQYRNNPQVRAGLGANATPAQKAAAQRVNEAADALLQAAELNGGSVRIGRSVQGPAAPQNNPVRSSTSPVETAPASGPTVRTTTPGALAQSARASSPDNLLGTRAPLAGRLAPPSSAGAGNNGVTVVPLHRAPSAQNLPIVAAAPPPARTPGRLSADEIAAIMNSRQAASGTVTPITSVRLPGTDSNSVAPITAVDRISPSIAASSSGGISSLSAGTITSQAPDLNIVASANGELDGVSNASNLPYDDSLSSVDNEALHSFYQQIRAFQAEASPYLNIRKGITRLLTVSHGNLQAEFSQRGDDTIHGLVLTDTNTNQRLYTDFSEGRVNYTAVASNTDLPSIYLDLDSNTFTQIQKAVSGYMSYVSNKVENDQYIYYRQAKRVLSRLLEDDRTYMLIKENTPNHGSLELRDGTVVSWEASSAQQNVTRNITVTNPDGHFELSLPGGTSEYARFSTTLLNQGSWSEVVTRQSLIYSYLEEVRDQAMRLVADVAVPMGRGTKRMLPRAASPQVERITESYTRPGVRTSLHRGLPSLTGVINNLNERFTMKETSPQELAVAAEGYPANLPLTSDAISSIVRDNPAILLSSDRQFPVTPADVDAYLSDLQTDMTPGDIDFILNSVTSNSLSEAQQRMTLASLMQYSGISGYEVLSSKISDALTNAGGGTIVSLSNGSSLLSTMAYMSKRNSLPDALNSAVEHLNRPSNIRGLVQQLGSPLPQNTALTPVTNNLVFLDRSAAEILRAHPKVLDAILNNTNAEFIVVEGLELPSGVLSSLPANINYPADGEFILLNDLDIDPPADPIREGHHFLNPLSPVELSWSLQEALNTIEQTMQEREFSFEQALMEYENAASNALIDEFGIPEDRVVRVNNHTRTSSLPFFSLAASDSIANLTQANAFRPGDFMEMTQYTSGDPQQALTEAYARNFIFDDPSVYRQRARTLYREIEAIAFELDIPESQIYFHNPNPKKSYSPAYGIFSRVNDIAATQFLNDAHIPIQANSLIIVLDDATYSGESLMDDVQILSSSNPNATILSASYTGTDKAHHILGREALALHNYVGHINPTNQHPNPTNDSWIDTLPSDMESAYLDWFQGGHGSNRNRGSGSVLVASNLTGIPDNTASNSMTPDLAIRVGNSNVKSMPDFQDAAFVQDFFESLDD